MKIPRWLKCYLHQHDLKLIQASVKEAEEHTSGEIIPMVVYSSTPHRQNLLLLFFYFFSLLVISQDFFNIDQVMALERHVAWFFYIVISFLLSWIFANQNWVHRLILSKHDQNECVYTRALAEFHLQGLHNTKSGTGVLLFVSILERKAVVLADESISKHLEPHVWDQVVGALIQGAKSYKLDHGFAEAIGLSGQLLKKHFPCYQKNQNELSNHLIIKL